MEVVAVEGETLADAFIKRRQFGSEPVKCNLILYTKILQNSNNLSDGIDINIFTFFV